MWMFSNIEVKGVFFVCVWKRMRADLLMGILHALDVLYNYKVVRSFGVRVVLCLNVSLCHCVCKRPSPPAASSLH